MSAPGTGSGRWAGGVPAHLARYEFDSYEDVLARLTQSVEEERVAQWEICDLCAVARRMRPYAVTVDGKRRIDPAGRKVVGELAALLGVSGQTVRRWMKVGETFPPLVIGADGTPLQVRDYSRPFALYETALSAIDFGLDPVSVVLYALEHDMSPGQLATWISDESYRQTGRLPPVWRELYDRELTDPHDAEDVVRQVHQALLDWNHWNRWTQSVRSIRIRISGLVDADQA